MKTLFTSSVLNNDSITKLCCTFLHSRVYATLLLNVSFAALILMVSSTSVQAQDHYKDHRDKFDGDGSNISRGSVGTDVITFVTDYDFITNINTTLSTTNGISMFTNGYQRLRLWGPSDNDNYSILQLYTPEWNNSDDYGQISFGKHSSHHFIRGSHTNGMWLFDVDKINLQSDGDIQLNAGTNAKIELLDPLSVTGNISSTAKVSGTTIEGTNVNGTTITGTTFNGTNISGSTSVSGGYLNSANGEIRAGGDHLELMRGVRSNDNDYEWVGFYSGTTRQDYFIRWFLERCQQPN